MSRTATEGFLTGRKVKLVGEVLDTTFLVVGPHPRRAGWMRLQHTDGKRLMIAGRTEDIRPLPTADEVGWDVNNDLLPPHG